MSPAWGLTRLPLLPWRGSACRPQSRGTPSHPLGPPQIWSAAAPPWTGKRSFCASVASRWSSPHQCDTWPSKDWDPCHGKEASRECSFQLIYPKNHIPKITSISNSWVWWEYATYEHINTWDILFKPHLLYLTSCKPINIYKPESTSTRLLTSHRARESAGWSHRSSLHLPHQSAWQLTIPQHTCDGSIPQSPPLAHCCWNGSV